MKGFMFLPPTELPDATFKSPEWMTRADSHHDHGA
jgi:hypothetical protein